MDKRSIPAPSAEMAAAIRAEVYAVPAEEFPAYVRGLIADAHLWLAIDGWLRALDARRTDGGE